MTYILRVNNPDIVASLVPKLVGEGEMLLKLLLQVRRAGKPELAEGQLDGLGLEPGRLGESFRDLAYGQPLSVGDEVLAGAVVDEGLDERAGIFVVGDPGQLQVEVGPVGELVGTIISLRLGSARAALSVRSATNSP